MLGLRNALCGRGYRARIWDEATVFGQVATSVDRLRTELDRLPPGSGVVTHSFGDWLFRVAVGDSMNTVASLVSIAPVMAASRAARWSRALARLLPGLAIMSSDDRASRASQTPIGIDRCIIWPTIDLWTRRVDVSRMSSTRSVVIVGTHNTLVWQPAVHRAVAGHLHQSERCRDRALPC
jgi:hypothetical protein